ncbi:MAG: hypothetical protein KC619_10060 [Myxococcales bacterium]|nr:hypothetical protein [Myxococcales bacterium]
MPRLASTVSITALLTLAACGGDATQLLVEIDTDLPLDVEPPTVGDRALRAVHVEVCDDSCDDAAAPRTSRTWAVGRIPREGRVAMPFSFGVAPFQGDTRRAVEIRVEALRRTERGDPDALLFEVRRRRGFVDGQKTRVPIFLGGACLECPPGLQCNGDGECEGVDGGVPDAGSMDGGGPSCERMARTPAEVVPIQESASALLTAAARAEPPSSGGEPELFVAGRDGGGELFVERRRAWSGVTWRTRIVTSESVLFLSEVVGLAHVGEQLYAVATIGEDWTFVDHGGFTIPAPVAGVTFGDSRRHGTVVFALDAASGAPRWAHTIKRLGVTDQATGIASDEGGIWLAGIAIGGSLGALELDRGPWPTTLEQTGPEPSRAYLLRVALDGTVASFRGLSGGDVFVRDLGIAPGGDGSLLVAAGGTGIALDPFPGRRGDVLLGRLDAAGATSWSRGLECRTGAGMRSTSIRVARGVDRGWVAFAAEQDCRDVWVEGGAAVQALPLGDPGSAWILGLAFDPDGGDVDTGSTWIASVRGSPPQRVVWLEPTTQGAVVGGYVGHGGADLGGGPLAGRDTGTGTDSFVAGFDTCGYAFGELFGPAAAGNGPEDGVGAVMALGDEIVVFESASASFSLGAVVVPRGASAIRYVPE